MTKPAVRPIMAHAPFTASAWRFLCNQITFCYQQNALTASYKLNKPMKRNDFFRFHTESSLFSNTMNEYQSFRSTSRILILIISFDPSKLHPLYWEIQLCSKTWINCSRKNYYKRFLALKFSFALIPSICLAANRFASKGSTMITTFFEFPFPEDTYMTEKEQRLTIWKLNKG